MQDAGEGGQIKTARVKLFNVGQGVAQYRDGPRRPVLRILTVGQNIV